MNDSDISAWFHSFIFEVEEQLSTQFNDDAWSARDLLNAMQDTATRKFVQDCK